VSFPTLADPSSTGDRRYAFATQASTHFEDGERFAIAESREAMITK
jgi:hypothetical protein